MDMVLVVVDLSWIHISSSREVGCICLHATISMASLDLFDSIYLYSTNAI